MTNMDVAEKALVETGAVNLNLHPSVWFAFCDGELVLITIRRGKEVRHGMWHKSFEFGDAYLKTVALFDEGKP